MEREDFNEVAKKALEFTKRYYKILDDTENRSTLMEFYANFSNLCEWNGHKYSTQADIFNYVKQLPKTNHKINIVDAQPLPGNVGEKDKNTEADHTFLITVNGLVTYDDEHKREFFQRFVIRQKGAIHYIVHDYYRWLSEKM